MTRMIYGSCSVFPDAPVAPPSSEEISQLGSATVDELDLVRTDGELFKRATASK